MRLWRYAPRDRRRSFCGFFPAARRERGRIKKEYEKRAPAWTFRAGALLSETFFAQKPNVFCLEKTVRKNRCALFLPFLGFARNCLGLCPKPRRLLKKAGENFMFEMPYEISFPRISMKENMQKRGDLL